MVACELRVRAHAADALSKLVRKDQRIIQDHMTRMAAERSHPLDLPQHRVRRLPPDLAHVRKERKGRHRVYYIGHSSLCHYDFVLLKRHKKSDVDPEDAPSFHGKLRAALSAPVRKRLVWGTGPSHRQRE